MNGIRSTGIYRKASGVVMLGTIMVLGWSSPSFGRDITYTNVSKTKNVTLSCLSVFENENQGGTHTVILIAGPTPAQSVDDIVVPPENTVGFNTDKDGNGLPDWKSKSWSFKDAKGEHLHKSNGDGVFPLFSPDVVTDLFVAICNEPAPSIAEGTTFVITNGTTVALPGFFFSTTDFGITDDVSCTLDGNETGFNGTVTVELTIAIGSSIVPAVSEWGVALMVLLVLTVGTLAIRARRARGRRRCNPMT